MNFNIMKGSEHKKTRDGYFGYICIEYDHKALFVETAKDGRFVLADMHWDFLKKNLPDYETVSWLINNEETIREALKGVSFVSMELPSIYEG